MKIIKIINNNVVSALDENNHEVVLMGKGIGFKAKENDIVKSEQIEKIFKMDSQKSVERFKELLVTLPLEHIQVSNQIIEYAKECLGKRMNQNVYITLTDHINFAVERYSQGMIFSNPLLWEVKKFYPSEYLIGEYAIRLIEEKLNITLEEDEAASIALHLVNAEYDTAMNQAFDITAMIKSILDIVRNFIGKNIDEESLYYSRFVTHLKFLSQRICKKQLLDNDDPQFKEFITTTYPEEFKCSQRIAEFIEEKYQYHITTEELMYLTVHIKRICTSSESNGE